MALGHLYLLLPVGGAQVRTAACPLKVTPRGLSDMILAPVLAATAATVRILKGL